MRVLLLSDLRGAVERIPQVREVVEKNGIHAVIFAGNVIGEDERVHAFEKALETGTGPDIDDVLLKELEDKAVAEYEAFFDQLGTLGVPVFVVPGYLDAPERLFLQAALNHEVVAPDVHMVHRSFVPMPSENLTITGFGGAITSTGERENRLVLMYPDWEALFAFEFLRHVKQTPFFIFHTPPRRDPVDRDHGRNVGQHVVDELIKTYRPRYAVVGMAREGQGTTMIGTTLVINPGPLYDGHYAILDTHTDKVTFERLPEPVHA